jgi:hypothetical protein
MKIPFRRLPGLAIATVALALSASLVFAGQPLGSRGATSDASTHATTTAPDTAGGADQGTETEAPDASEAPNASEAPDATDAPGSGGSTGNCSVDLTQDPSVLLTLNHGSVVCSAANATTWDTTLYPTKGAWVSHFAKMNHGHDPNRTHGHAGG